MASLLSLFPKGKSLRRKLYGEQWFPRWCSLPWTRLAIHNEQYSLNSIGYYSNVRAPIHCSCCICVFDSPRKPLRPAAIHRLDLNTPNSMATISNLLLYRLHQAYQAFEHQFLSQYSSQWLRQSRFWSYAIHGMFSAFKSHSVRHTQTPKDTLNFKVCRFDFKA